MYKVLIFDCTGESSMWCKIFLNKDVEVIKTITTSDRIPNILFQKNSWDWLLIFERNMKTAFETMIRNLKLPLEKIIYALDSTTWIQHPNAIYTLLNNSKEANSIRRYLNISNCLAINDFFTCTAEGLSYITYSEDQVRITNMFVSQLNWASSEMKRFQELAKQYYNVDESSGYFFDLGANLGTTGLYFTKKLAPNLKLLSFEPDPQNFKMHRINIILNDMEEQATLVNCGLSNEPDELMLYRRFKDNWGGNTFIKNGTDTPIATIKVIPLDSYLAQNKIKASEVKYIWIDTEGFEPKVLLGAKNLIKENPAPIFMECNLKAWDKSGLFDDMMNLLSEGYSHFIHFWHGETIYPINALRTMERPNNLIGQIGDIFLIKKGAIV